ncbi:MAG: DUF2232 domain-containing protein [bacterium]
MFGRVSKEAPADAAATAERGWGKFLIAIVAFLVVPMIPQMRAVLPVEQTMLLLVPAIAACSLVGWWAGGRAFTAIAWVAIAALMTAQSPAAPMAFYNLVRGWSLLLAGAFGLVCLFGASRPLFSRSMIALATALVVATIMSLLGPVSPSQAAKTVADEFARRNKETMTTLNATIQTYPKEWADLSAKVPALAQLPTETATELSQLSSGGLVIFPALLALQSLAALALAWGTYHRLARSRIGSPLRPLRDFRFNDQLVWGLIVGLTVMLLPTLKALHGVGKNLLIFFGALYAVRGFGVLTWFMAPGSLGVTLTVGFILLLAPVINVFAALAFMMLGVTSLALGLGDTWADWRKRARPTP